MTATITIRQPAANDDRTWLARARADVVAPISDLFRGPRPPRANCLPAFAEPDTVAEMIPVSAQPVLPSPETIQPGVAPGLDISPRNR